MGWWASDQATLYFDNCRVPASHMMGEEDRGFIAIMKNFNYERLSLIAGALGMMKTCLEESIAYAQQRETFGKPLIKHQVIRHKIAEMSAKVDQIESYMNIMCWQINEGQMPVAEICKGKFAATKALEFVASEAMQIYGGAAYLRGNPVERIYREVKVFAIGGWYDDTPAFTFKTSESDFYYLSDEDGFRPAPYFASRGIKWIQQFGDNVSDDDVKFCLKESHRIVSLGLSKKKQKELGLNQS